MNHSVKGLLLSGLVLPGLGQMVLKRYLRGLIFLLSTLGALAVILARVIRAALKIIASVQTTQELVAPDQAAAALDQAMAGLSSPLIGAAILALVLVWIISALDAYRIGRRMDQPNVRMGSTSR
jgi:hypothetical protein